MVYQCDVCAQNFLNLPEFNIHRGLAHRARDSGVCNSIPPGRPTDEQYLANMKRNVFINRVPGCKCDERGVKEIVSHESYKHPAVSTHHH